MKVIHVNKFVYSQLLVSELLHLKILQETIKNSFLSVSVSYKSVDYLKYNLYTVDMPLKFLKATALEQNYRYVYMYFHKIDPQTVSF